MKVNTAMRYARVKVEGEESLVVVPVSSRKPAIPATIVEKWQKIVDLVAGIMHVPSGLITRFTEENLEVVVASIGPGNPYKRDDHDSLGIGMFCETVVGKRRPLQVDDTGASAFWSGNPHAGLGMKSYIGVPIQWEDGELFGTFCMLNDKANAFQPDFLELMRLFKDIIETDLRSLLLLKETEERLGAKELELREIHHRLKNQLNILISYINLQTMATSDEAIRSTLREVQHRVLAVSMIHEELCGDAGVSDLSLDSYLRRICDAILEDFVKGDIGVEYRIGDIRLSMEKLLSIALIVSELLTNSVKHAFPDSRPKRISIRAERTVEGRLELVYRDNGVGLQAAPPPSEGAAPPKESLGTILIRALVQQLEGTMLAESNDGAKFTFLLKA